jgi:HEAT repeat protein
MMMKTPVQDEKQNRIAVLITALEDPHVSVVWNATRDLAKLGPAASSALPALRIALKSHDPTSRLWARFAIAKITGDEASHLTEFIKALNNKKGIFPGMASAALAGFGRNARAAVPLLIAELAEENAEYRWSAAGALANIGPEAAEAVPTLIQTLEDQDEKVRWYAAWALGEIGSAAEPAVSALIGLLDDIDDDVRGYAARSIAKIGGTNCARALPRLEAMAHDENPNLRSAAQEAITRIGKQT